MAEIEAFAFVPKPKVQPTKIMRTHYLMLLCVGLCKFQDVRLLFEEVVNSVVKLLSACDFHSQKDTTDTLFFDCVSNPNFQ